MINFVICDDNEKILQKIIEVVQKSMINSIYEYKIHDFKDYNSKFKNLVKEKLPNKIYILDVETPSESGIDMARLIRKDDVNSVIIFLTSHNEVGSLLLKEALMFLTFICKYDNAEERLSKSIKKALELVGKQSAIRFEDHGVLYTLPVKDITHIYTDTIERKIIINTDYAQFKISKTLTEMEEMLPKQFKHSHRACIVNTDRIRIIDKSKNIIIFDNNQETEYLSKSFKKELM
jgi:two-component system response regulator AgrA